MNDLNDPNTSRDKKETRNMILAVVLSTLVMGVGFTLTTVLFPPKQAQTTSAGTQTTQTSSTSDSSVTTAAPVAGGQPTIVLPAVPAVPETSAAGSLKTVAVPEVVPEKEEVYTVETNRIIAQISNAGGDIVSLKLKDHKDKTGNVEMLLPGEKGTSGLSVAFGKADAAPMKELMNVTWLDDAHTIIQFSRTLFAKPQGQDQAIPFVYKKIYNFKDNEYMFGMAISLENFQNADLPLNANGTAYTIQIGPQIGPAFNPTNRYSDFRKYIYEVEGKKKSETPKVGVKEINEPASWASITGKYFTFIAIPSSPFARFEYMQGTDPVLQQTDWIFMSRPAVQTSRQTDTYYFYFGPKTSGELAKYEYADKNPYGLSSLKLEDTIERSSMLGWLENILKFLLDIFYKIIPNYGVAIILVTILIKAIFYPLTKKGSFATARMQELQPQIQELQTKYKGNQEKLNQEMAELYKREHYNPMSGCLPMLIQLPLFFAMYNLFNNHFELRGASFIPGWIYDLSQPEAIVSFGGFRVPLLGWTALRALPIIYLVSQLLYGKFTQQPQTQQNQQAAAQMKLMTFGMPIIFFFILYDVPSGLLIYWIVNNVITIIQQMIINNMMKKHKAETLAMAGPVLVGISTEDDVKASSTKSSTKSSAIKTSAVTKGANSSRRGNPKGPKSGGSRQGEDFSARIVNWLEKKADNTQKDAGKKDKKSSRKSGDKKESKR